MAAAVLAGTAVAGGLWIALDRPLPQSLRVPPAGDGTAAAPRIPLEPDWLVQGELKGWIEDYTARLKTANTSAEHAKLLDRLGLLHEAAGETGEALSCFEKLAKEEGEAVRPQTLARLIRMLAAERRASEAEPLRLQARDLLRERSTPPLARERFEISVSAAMLYRVMNEPDRVERELARARSLRDGFAGAGVLKWANRLLAMAESTPRR